MVSLDNFNDELTPSDMKTVINLLSLYSEVNQKVINEHKNKCSIFKRVTRILQEII